MRRVSRIPSVVGAVVAWMLLTGAAGAEELPTPHPDLPPEFEQLLPRGRIASVDDPRFEPDAAADIPDDAWVLGVEMEGEARAYSLNLLNRHEVVNDRIGERSFAAVW